MVIWLKEHIVVSGDRSSFVLNDFTYLVEELIIKLASEVSVTCLGPSLESSNEGVQSVAFTLRCLIIGKVEIPHELFVLMMR